jgi:hypothetical protein
MKKIFFSVLMLSGVVTVQAQDFDVILSGSKADANKYLENYLRPFGEGQIYNMARGWSSTAKAHKFLGFDISVNVQAAIVPDKLQSFNFKNSEYGTFALAGGATSANLPTFLGGKTTQNINVTTTVNGQSARTTFRAPDGIGQDMKDAIGYVAVPLPVAQVGIGFIKNTDIKVRYFPQTSFDGVKVGVFGVGLQHEFSYLPIIKKAPFLRLAALVAYNRVTSEYDLSDGGLSGSNQRTAIDISALTVQGMASVKFLIFEVYASAGFIAGNSNMGIKGNYSVTYTGPPPGNLPITATITDPVDLKYKQSGFTNTWGLRLNLAFLKVYADYTFAKYNGAGAGIALSIR